MITIVENGDIFESGCEALVNPVNTKGVMGKGLAQQFKERYPQMFSAYVKACELGLLAIGQCHVYVVSDRLAIINFPTKDDWKNPSEIEYIRSGLENLKKWILAFDIKSIAIPALGCGLGGLNFKNDVMPLIESILGEMDGVEIKVCAPKGECGDGK